MVRRVREHGLHLLNRQPEISRDFRFINARFPVLNYVIGRHASAPQHGAAALYAGFYFNEGAICPVHKTSFHVCGRSWCAMVARLQRSGGFPGYDEHASTVQGDEVYWQARAASDLR